MNSRDPEPRGIGLARLLLAAALPVGLTGCDSATPSSQPVAPSWNAVEVLRIGSLDSPGHILTQVGSLVVGSNDQIYLSQPQERLIRVYDRSGLPVRLIGGPGDGPGEFRSIFWITLVGDTLVGMDHGSRRLSFFSAEGDFLESRGLTSPALGDEYFPTPPFGFFSDGSAIVSPTFSPGTVRRIPYLRIDREGAILDTLWWQDLEGLWVDSSTERVRGSLPHPFPYSPRIAFGPDGFVVADQGITSEAWSPEFGLTWHSQAGDTVWDHRYSYTPIALESTEVDRAVSRLAESPSIRFIHGDAGEAERHIRSRLHVPPVYPPIARLVMAGDGIIWLAREPAGAEHTIWMAVGDRGEVLGSVALPSVVQIHFARGSFLWGVAQDALDVPYIVQYQVESCRLQPC